MPKKRKDVQKSLRELLGKETADAILQEVDKLAKEGAPLSAIEKAVLALLSKHIQNAGKAVRLVIVDERIVIRTVK